MSEWLDEPGDPLEQLEKLRLLRGAMGELEAAISARHAAAVRGLIEVHGTTVAALRLKVHPSELFALAREA